MKMKLDPGLKTQLLGSRLQIGFKFQAKQITEHPWLTESGLNGAKGEESPDQPIDPSNHSFFSNSNENPTQSR